MKLKNRRSGFSLPEVMFAIMILGIGFIMVAAMFPVAIRQAKDGQDDTTAAEITKSAISTLQQCLNVAPTGTPPSTGAGDGVIANGVATENWNLWNDGVWGFRGSVIYSPDPRYAWTALYRRGTAGASPAPYVQVFIFVLTAPDGRAFDINDVAPAAGRPNLWPRRVEIQQVAGFNDQVLIRDDTGVGAYPTATGAVVENAYLVVQDGTTFRVASYVGPTGVNQWQLYPGQNASAYTAWTKAWLVGRRNSATALPTYSGNAQDIAVYTTYLRAN